MQRQRGGRRHRDERDDGRRQRECEELAKRDLVTGNWRSTRWRSDEAQSLRRLGTYTTESSYCGNNLYGSDFVPKTDPTIRFATQLIRLAHPRELGGVADLWCERCGPRSGYRWLGYFLRIVTKDDAQHLKYGLRAGVGD
jgi:hypothetical protein